MSGRVCVVGVGVGTLTCASLLARQGWAVTLQGVGRRPSPVLVLNEVTLALLDDLWGADVASGSHPVTQRRVRWGPGADEVVVPVTSAALDGRILVDRLLGRLAQAAAVEGPVRWVIDGTRQSSRPGPAWPERCPGPAWPERCRRVRFGSRCVIQAEVELLTDEVSTAWVETVDEGWIHMAALGHERAVLQCMVPTTPVDPAAALARMVAATTGIRHRVGPPEGPVAHFPAAPSLSIPACEPAWIGVADAAVSLDPISGFGTAWSLRGGVLAAAVVQAISSGLPEADCLRHYDDRLRTALFEHVEQCLQIYGAAFSTPAWRRELDDMARTLEDERRLRPEPAFALRLNGLRLDFRA